MEPIVTNECEYFIQQVNRHGKWISYNNHLSKDNAIKQLDYLRNFFKDHDMFRIMEVVTIKKETILDI